MFKNKNNEEIENLTIENEALKKELKELKEKFKIIPLREYTLTFKNKRKVKVIGHHSYPINKEKKDNGTGFSIYKVVNGHERIAYYFEEFPVEFSCVWLTEEKK